MSSRIFSLEVIDYQETTSKSGNRFIVYSIKTHAVTRFIHPSCINAENPSFVINSRYSELLALHRQLQKSFPKLPSFPQKMYLFRPSAESIRTRMEDLNIYFSKLLRVPNIGTSETLLKLVKPVRQVTIKIEGEDREKLVEACFSHCKFFKPTEVERYLPIDFIIGKEMVRVQKITFESNQIPDGILRCHSEVNTSQLPSISVRDKVGDPQMAFACFTSLLQLIKLYD